MVGEGVRSEGGESEGKAEGQLLSLLQHSHSLTPFVPSSLSPSPQFFPYLE